MYVYICTYIYINIMFKTNKLQKEAALSSFPRMTPPQESRPEAYAFAPAPGRPKTPGPRALSSGTCSSASEVQRSDAKSKDLDLRTNAHSGQEKNPLKGKYSKKT